MPNYTERKIKEFKEKFLYYVVLGSTMNDGNALRFKRVEPDGDEVVAFLRTALEEQKAEVIEMLDEMAFENDDGYKVELLINWDEAKKKLLDPKPKGDDLLADLKNNK